MFKRKRKKFIIPQDLVIKKYADNYSQWFFFPKATKSADIYFITR